ncbi:outer membrane lipoprotein-sorting protein [Vibrio gigantis]|uniref:outer membrane lipoprotein-sorting protein n=1 Tax=Vibrio gigantis TaxID=296199 RepID=UPI0035A66602
MKKLIISTIFALLSLTASAQDIGLEEIVKKNIATNKGFGDSYETMKMIIKKDGGDQVERLMKSKSLEVDGDGNKVLMIFQDPSDVKGSAVLTHSRIKGNDDQWIYLPAVKRVKRISSANKSGPFMGSEFAFEDLSSIEYEKFTYQLLDQETVDGTQYYRVERKPTYARSGYSRQIVWIDTENFLTHKVELFDTSGKKYKTQELSNYKNYFGNFWRAHSIVMTNHLNGNSTEMQWIGDISFNNGFSNNDFTKNAMKR